MDSDCHKKGKLSPPINYLTIGDELEMTVNVKEKDLDTSLQTGPVPFLSTAATIVYLEQCCVALIDPKLPVGHDSVSVDMCVKHLHTAKKNEEISCKVHLNSISDRKIFFDVVVLNSKGQTVGIGMHERFIVCHQTFIDKNE